MTLCGLGRTDGSVISEELTMMVETARKVVRDEIIEPKLDMAYDRSGDFPHEIYKKLWEQGLVQLEFPESIGGAGLSCFEHCAIGEEIAYGCLGVNTSVQGNSLAAMPLLIVDDPELNKEFLAPLLEEPIYAAYACSEPDAGSDVAAMTTRYRKVGDSYVQRTQALDYQR